MFFLRILSSLPLNILYAISDFAFFITYHIVRYRRQLVRINLVNSFPEKERTEIKAIEEKFYRNLADYGVETLKLLTIRKEELIKRVVFKNVEVMQKYKDNNQSVIILTSHQFNWEWMLSAGHLKLPHSVDFVYQAIHTSVINNFSMATRTRFGGHPIERAEVAREVLKRKEILRSIAIVADQYPGKKKDKKFPLTFLGQDTVFFEGANQLAILTQYPVVFAAVRKLKRGCYETTFVKIADPPYSRQDTHIISRYAQEVEHLIREDPAGWLWSHKRWKKRHLKTKQR